MIPHSSAAIPHSHLQRVQGLRSFLCHLSFCSYCMMQSCWALDSRERPSFSYLVSSLASQLAEAEGAVSKYSVMNMWTRSGFGFGFLWGLYVAPQITMRWGIASCFLFKYTTLLWIHCPWIHLSWGMFFCHQKESWPSWQGFSSSHCLYWKSGKLKSLSLCGGNEHPSCSSKCSQVWWCCQLPCEGSWACARGQGVSWGITMPFPHRQNAVCHSQRLK